MSYVRGVPLGSGNLFPSQATRTGTAEVVLAPGSQKTIFRFNGKQGLDTAYLHDNTGYVRWSLSIDGIEYATSPYIWIIVNALTGFNNTGAAIGEPTGYGTNAVYSGKATYIQGSLQTNSDGDVISENLTITDPNVKASGYIDIRAGNYGTTDADVVATLITRDLNGNVVRL